MYISPQSRRVSRRHRTRTSLQRLLPSLVMVGALTAVFGCELGSDSSGCECSVGGVTEPMLYGPFDYEPGAIDDHEPTGEFDANAERMYFLWGHPDAANVPLTFRIYGQTIGFDPPGVLLVEETAEIDSQSGHFFFAMPTNGWPHAHYRVEADLDGATFGVVEFDIGPGAGRQ